MTAAHSPAAPQEGTTPLTPERTALLATHAAVRKAIYGARDGASVSSSGTTTDEIEQRIAAIEAGATRVMGFCEVDPDFSPDCVSFGDALWLIAQLRALLDSSSINLSQTDSSLRAAEPTTQCGVCLGQPLKSGRKCICDGVGTEQAEMHGLRVALFDAEAELERLRASSPTVTPPQTPKIDVGAADDVIEYLRGWYGRFERDELPVTQRRSYATLDPSEVRDVVAVFDGLRAARSTPTEEKTNA